MKLEKITVRRRYEDACGTAHALDLLGERWAILVLRELLFGPRRFGDLRASLPGLSANVLAQRLEGLEAAGVIVRRKLAPPASVQVYELTSWGREAEPIILALGRWGARSPGHDPTLPLSPVSMMLSFRAMFDPARAKGMQVKLAVHCGAETFLVSVANGELTGEKRADGRPSTLEVDFEVAGSPGAVCSGIYGLVSLQELEQSGDIVVRGDRAAVRRFQGVFAFPEKAVRTGEER